MDNKHKLGQRSSGWKDKLPTSSSQNHLATLEGLPGRTSTYPNRKPLLSVVSSRDVGPHRCQTSGSEMTVSVLRSHSGRANIAFWLHRESDTIGGPFCGIGVHFGSKGRLKAHAHTHTHTPVDQPLCKKRYLKKKTFCNVCILSRSWGKHTVSQKES